MLFKFWMKTSSVTIRIIQLEAVEPQHFPVVPFIMLCNIYAVEFVNEILKL